MTSTANNITFNVKCLPYFFECGFLVHSNSELYLYVIYDNRHETVRLLQIAKNCNNKPIY